MIDDFGIAPGIAKRLREFFDQAPPGIERVWVYGSRARGSHRPDSDIDLCIDAPSMSDGDYVHLKLEIQDDGLIYDLDITRWQTIGNDDFRARIERDRKLFWQPRRHAANVEAVGGIALKDFQSRVLAALGDYIDELKKKAATAQAAQKALRAMENMADLAREAGDFPKQAWQALNARRLLPPAFAERPHSSRFDGAGRPIPNVCLKVPTGGGKTLLAASAVARVFSAYLGRHTGLVLWIVPNEAIYRQTLKALADRDHPYRQILNVAGAGRVKILEKNSPLSRLDVESHLCVMVLMLASAARQSKETLRFFRDRGNVRGFLPRDDDLDAHWALLEQVPNLDVYAAWGQSQEEARAQKGSVVKSSLGNVMRLLRPLVVMDEGHHAYTENALRTLDGFNPCFLLELSATPRVASAKGSGSNILVDVRGADLDEAQMIKLPIHVDVQHWNDWQSCLAAAVQRLETLQREAQVLQGETARYIRPILLVQVERTGADLRDAGFIHAEDARAYLLQLGLSERQIAIKTAEKNDLAQPENIDLLSSQCEVRVIITKQALQEGWDCPFAYVLCALAAGRNPAAMMQLVGRILRQPQVAKTGREALDACYVLCHDARTGEVVRAIKKSLEDEGMGDLALTVSDGETSSTGQQEVRQTRRAGFAGLRLFVPKVTWVENTENNGRRELDYESDILARVAWERVDAAALARDWAPDDPYAMSERFDVDLSILGRGGVLRDRNGDADNGGRLDRARIVRALLDLAPNAWQVWGWVDAVVARLLGGGCSETRLAGSSAALIERLRIDVERERDRLAEAAFLALVAEGRVEFALRADAADFELPSAATLALPARAAELPIMRDDHRPVEKSLLEPALRSPDMNAYELACAGYLDSQQALRWWHRNVAKSQYGLQGWKRHKVYPDFVFACVAEPGVEKLVLLETKGLHLGGSDDTRYKQALLERLSAAFSDKRHVRGGEFTLEGGNRVELACDLLFDEATWRNALQSRHFSGGERY
ncbi:MAG: DEAD/DEAH box helicase family protein [Propionivibrio sp.]|uniref:DEAD/DEAH box helicase family protein n=1 Tax=Propionivibrio sp. TaxID=2212460 RepID=UPI001B507E8E|nr:DEAD/DEAH box helicase family protein [Propionivibrio sp.]MBP7203266.1 DEAD/DEAH box helicase family protein [Propionivibrio sp.]